MAGGTWTAQNKVRPGVYIRFRTRAAAGLVVGERGVVAIAEPLSWGEVGVVHEIDATTDVTPYTGYDINDSKNRFLQEIFKGSNRTSAPKKVLLYRPTQAGSVAAAVTTGNLTASAAYPGVRGNDLTIVISADPENENKFIVTTVLDGDTVDVQNNAAAVADLENNAWVKFTGTGSLATTAGAALVGGLDGSVADSAYSAFLTAIEPYEFDTLIYDGASTTVQAAMIAFVKRLADETGMYVQLVTANATAPDSRFVVNVTSGVVMDDGTTLSAAQCTWWVGGATSGAAFNESLTYAQYPGAVSVTPKLTNSQYEAALNAGKFVFSEDDGRVLVEQDIDSLTTFTPDIGKVYRKNRVMRLCNTIANDLFRQFSRNYIGVVNNNETGRARFKAAICGYLLEIQSAEGIQDFTPDDVEVLAGNDIDAVVVNLSLYAVDSVEKIYMTIEL